MKTATMASAGYERASTLTGEFTGDNVQTHVITISDGDSQRYIYDPADKVGEEY
jgi:hypothetical protein